MRLLVPIRGVEPSPRTSADSAWREAVAHRVEELFPDAPYAPPPGTRFAVQVDFFLVPERLYQQAGWPDPPDLDNLLKPLLDTLFTSRNVRGPTGVLVTANDTNVVEVRATKPRADTQAEQGANIVVAWDDVDAP